MPKSGTNIYKRQDGRWEGRYSKGRKDNGKIIYVSVYAKTCGEVKARLISVAKEPLKPKLQAGTVADLAQKWLSVVSLRVKPSTLSVYEATIRLHIAPQLGSLKPQDLTTGLISNFARNKLENGRVDGNDGLSPKTVRDMLSVLKGVVSFAAQEGFLKNPVKITYPKHGQKTMRTLSRLEQSEIKKALLSGITVYKAGILLCLYTGLRLGEVCALRWQDFSAGFDRLTVRQSVRRVTDKSGGKGRTKLLTDAPKSKASVREVPISKFLAPILKGLSQNKGVNFSKDAYFLSAPESSITDPRTLQNHFKRVIEAVGLPGANFHCLRHSFSTWCVEAGVDVKSLSEMLGHSNVNITLNRYVHSSFEQKIEGVNRLEKHLDL